MVKISKTHHVTKKGQVKHNPPKKNSSTKIERYPGDWVNEKGEQLSFNLYPAEYVIYDETIQNIMNNMNQNHLRPLQRLFMNAGLRLHKFVWYSPKSYNYQGDSVDLMISVSDRRRLLLFIKNNKQGIQKMLDGNVSRSGYISFTSNSVDEVIQKINDNFDVDPMVIAYITSQYPLDEYNDYLELLVEEESDED